MARISLSTVNKGTRPWWVDRLVLVTIAVGVTIFAAASLSNLCDAWLCTSLPVQEFVRTWVVPIGVIAASAFALGVPAVGLALCGTLLGAVIGEPVGGRLFQRAPFAAAVGASLGCWAGGLLGIQNWRVGSVGGPALPSRSLLVAAAAAFFLGVATAWSVPRMIVAADAVCREPAIGGLCHRDLIGLLIAMDAAFIGWLFVVSARHRSRADRSAPAPDRSGREPRTSPTAS